MAEYGYYKSKKEKKRPVKRGGRFWLLLLKAMDIVFVVATVGCSLLLLCGLLSKVVNPAKLGLLAVTGLIFPVVYIAELICGFYWTMRWRKYAFLCGAMLLAGAGSARSFYQVDFRERYDESGPQRTELVVMSYNVMNYSYPRAKGEKRPVENIARHVKENFTDIWCVQESNGGQAVKAVTDNVIPEMRHHYFRGYSGRESDMGIGLSIYSKYPFLARGVVTEADPDRVRAIWVDIRIKHDTVRVVNCHLQSTYIKDSDIDYLSSLRIVTEERGRNRMKEIVGRLNENYEKRAPQAAAIGAFIRKSPHPVILCGDFNDTPVSYAYHKLSRGMKDAFVVRGRGTAGTYNGFFNMFRIDYIMMSDGMEILNYYPFDVVYSDHNPVAASFDFKMRPIQAE